MVQVWADLAGMVDDGWLVFLIVAAVALRFAGGLLWRLHVDDLGARN